MYKKSHQHVCADNYLLPFGTVGIKGRNERLTIRSQVPKRMVVAKKDDSKRV